MADFGVAYIQQDTSKPLRCDLASGTKQYLAPEVFTKSHIHGPESDFWSLGVIAYELLYKKRPFEKHAPADHIKYLERGLEIYNAVQSYPFFSKSRHDDIAEYKDFNNDDRLSLSDQSSPPSTSSPGRSMIYSATPTGSPIGSPFGSPFGSPTRSPYSTKELSVAKRLVSGHYDKELPDKFPCILKETAPNKASFDTLITPNNSLYINEEEEDDWYQELPPPYMGYYIVTHWAVHIDYNDLDPELRKIPVARYYFIRFISIILITIII